MYVYVCVCVCVCPEIISAVLEFTLCSYCNHNHMYGCIYDSVHVCVNTQSIDILL